MTDDNRTGPRSDPTAQQLEAWLLAGLNSGPGRPLDPEAGRTDADRELDTILKRVRWVGPGPEPSEDEVQDMANDAVHEFRARRAQ